MLEQGEQGQRDEYTLVIDKEIAMNFYSLLRCLMNNPEVLEREFGPMAHDKLGLVEDYMKIFRRM